MHAVTEITGPALPLLLDDIDTDRIIPARYLRCVTFAGLGEYAFEDDRKQDPNHPFDQPQFQKAKLLIAGRNFGCGSSREHAPQALMRWGIGGIVGESFAEIFFGNCTGLGIPCVTASRSDLEAMAAYATENPDAEFVLDLNALTVSVTDGPNWSVTMNESARGSLTGGEWDFLAQLLEAKDEIKARADRVPYFTGG